MAKQHIDLKENRVPLSHSHHMNYALLFNTGMRGDTAIGREASAFAVSFPSNKTVLIHLT